MQSVTSNGVKNALSEKVNTNTYTDTNLNTLINTGLYVVRMVNQSPDNLNFPVAHFGTVLVGTTPSGNLMQMFMADEGQTIYVRNCTTNDWSGWVELANAFDELNIFNDTYYPSSFRFTVSNNFKGKIRVEVFDSNNTSIGSLDCIFYPGNILIKERNTVAYDLSDNILTLYLPSSAYCKHYIHADIIQGSIVSANYI